MTTSPSPAPPTTAGSAPVSPEIANEATTAAAATTANAAATATAATTTNSAPASLTEERTTTIGWFFIQSYYDFFVNKLDTIHKIYHANAVLSHDAYPTTSQDKVPATTHTARGIDAIKSRFAVEEEQATTNRIVITSATFQTSLDKNIIIVAFGEWAKSDSDGFRQFTQTFVLTPGKKENTFDVANDILKFIDVNGFTELNSEVKNKPAGEVEETAVVAVAEEESKEEQQPEEEEQEEEEEEQGEQEVNTTEETAVDSEPVSEVKEEETNGEVKVQVEPEEEEEQQQQQSEEPKSEAETSVSTPVATAATPSKPLSWADLASQSSAKAASAKAASPAASATAKPAAPAATGVTLKKQPPTSASPTGSSPTSNASGKFKKEDWFPIYIRGIKQLEEKSL
ncbi:uncharacterized protein SPAPADRAFT_63389, partial [Spathaspora passalidarum NRRL Y-27907]